MGNYIFDEKEEPRVNNIFSLVVDILLLNHKMHVTAKTAQRKLAEWIDMICHPGYFIRTMALCFFFHVGRSLS